MLAIAVIVIVIAGLALCVPLAAAGLVAVASRREDAAWTLNQAPSGPAAAAARKVAGFRARAIDWPCPQSRLPARQPEPAPARARSPRPARTRRPVADTR
jgi:hypothetical protein